MEAALTDTDALAAGTGALSVVRVAGRSVATRVLASSPLRLLLPDNDGHAVWAYATSFGGGLVDGDALRLDVNIGPGAAALLSTQASTKVFRARQRGASQSMRLRVEPSALAVVLPDPVVCFAGARYAQRTEIDLAPGASLVLLDSLHAGRVARGERWQFAHYSSRIDVRSEGRLLLTDRVVIDPAHGPLARRLRGYDALATLIIVGDHAASHAAELLARICARTPEPRATCMTSASPIAGGGALLRVAAATAADALAAVHEHLAFVPGLLGDNPFARRW